MNISNTSNLVKVFIYTNNIWSKVNFNNQIYKNISGLSCPLTQSRVITVISIINPGNNTFITYIILN